MSKKTLIVWMILITLAFGAKYAGAETTKGQHGVCVSEQTFDELTTAIVVQDTAALNYLVKRGVCLVLKEGLQASILDRGWSGQVKARIYMGDDAVVIWGPMEEFAR